MAQGRITKRSVEAIPLPIPGKRSFLWDDTLKGFGVMVMSSGVRSYILQYRLGGRGHPTRRATIGQHGNPWTAEKAREHAADLLIFVRKGIDPVEAERERQGQRLEKRKADEKMAFSAYADSFIKKHAEGRGLRSADDIKSVFRRDLKPFFGNRPITALKRTDIRDCLDHVGERSGSAANKAHKWLHKMFVWAADRGDLDSSPMIGMGRPHEDGQRKRVLRGVEIKHLWNGAGELSHPWSTLSKLLLLTGQRLREVAGMAWEEVDLDGKVWIIPSSRTKNKRDHLCPLSDQAVSVLTDLVPNKEDRKGLVLSTNGKTPISGFSKAKAALDDKIAEQVAKAAVWAGGDPERFDAWVFHDLRRSLATGCQAMGIPIEHTEALLNHVSGKRGGLVGVYQLHEYREEKTRAARAWGSHVAALLSETPRETNIVSIAGMVG
jgi:integrase